MPGLVGFTRNPNSCEDLASLHKMQEQITHFEFYGLDEAWSDEWFCGTRSHTNISQPAPQPHQVNNCWVWLDGEIYNRDEVSDSLGCEPLTDSQVLAELIWNNRHDQTFRFLRQINGIFSAVWYAPQEQKLCLITDRYGLRHLYWTVHNGQLAWASEYKAFLSLKRFQPRIDPQTIHDFFEVGYCLNDRTWFSDVQVLSPGSVLIWDFKQSRVLQVRYWDWSQIQPMDGPVDEEEVIEELGRLFRRAVERCCKQDARIGVQLSGGLDSRAILAAIPERVKPIHVFTFGRKGCDDIRIATQAAKVRGAVHHVVEIGASNWLNNRTDAVWWLDGQKNLLDMHCLHALSSSPQFYDIHLSGFLGGNTIGGSYLKQPGDDEFAVIENRGRRFIWGGLRLGWLFDEERPVFFDNDFIDFSMSIPESLRQDSYIYNRMLFTCYPEYFRKIPWQTTGCPISWPRPIVRPFSKYRWLRYKASHRLNRYGIRLREFREYTDYDRWLRQEPGYSTFSALLFNRSALYPEYVNREELLNLWRKHQAGADCASVICRYATFEIWLNQVFQKELRPAPRKEELANC